MTRCTFSVDKIITPENLIKMINPGSRIVISGGTAVPAYTIRTLTSSDMANRLDLEIIQVFNTPYYFGTDSSGLTGYRAKTFTGPSDEDCGSLISRGVIIPARAEEIPFLFESGSIATDMAFLVEDELQGCGIGTLMALYFTEIAKSRGIYNFIASVLCGNRRMFTIMKKLNILLNAHIEDDNVAELSFTL